MCVSGEEQGQKAGAEKVEEAHTQHNKTRIYSHTFPLVKGSQAHLAQMSQSQAAERLLKVLPHTQERIGGLGGVLPLRSGQVD